MTKRETNKNNNNFSLQNKKQKQNTAIAGKSQLLGNTSSIGCVSIVMLVSRGVQRIRCCHIFRFRIKAFAWRTSVAGEAWKKALFPSSKKRTRGSFFQIGQISETWWVFPEMVVPPKHPKMIIFSRKTNGCWVPRYHNFRNAPHIYIYIIYL